MKNKIYRLLTFFLILLFICSWIPVVAVNTAPFAVSGDMNGSYSTLWDACDAINSHNGQNYIIAVSGSDSVAGTDAVINSDKTITLTGGGQLGQPSGRHLLVKGTLILENIIIDGANTAGGIHVDGGKLEININAKLQNCVSSAYGGAVYAENSAEVTLNGGTLSNNRSNLGGGAIAISESGLVMNSGIIENNTITATGNNGGAGVFIDGSLSTFVMKDGSIAGNKVPSTINHSVGAGVCVSGGKFTMQGGTIKDNAVECVNSAYGGGVAITNGGLFTMLDGTISGNSTAGGPGGGVSVNNGAFEMKNGTITENKALNSNLGGGVFMGYGLPSTPAAFTMSGGTISQNTAAAGGGIFARYRNSTLVIKGGTIKDNVVTHYGGGIAAEHRDLTGTNDPGQKLQFTIENATVSGNKANNALYGGGGIYLSGVELTIRNSTVKGNETLGFGGGIFITGQASMDSSVDMNGGTITENTAGKAGGGVYLHSTGLSGFNMQSNANIYKNLADESGDDITSIGLSAISLLSVENMQIPGYNAENWYHDTIGNRYKNGDSTGVYTPMENDTSEQHLTLGVSAVYYTVIYKDGAEGNVFDDVTYPNLGYGDKTPSFNTSDPTEIPARPGYSFTGWLPEVETAVTQNMTYVAQWQPNSESSAPIDNSSSDESDSIPPTGDNTPAGTLIFLIIAAASGIITIILMRYKKKS